MDGERVVFSCQPGFVLYNGRALTAGPMMFLRLVDHIFDPSSVV
jgi:hypothetical protein